MTTTAVLYDLLTGETLLREQIAKRGRYISSNLAFNAKYGVLTEDKPLLLQFLEGAVHGGRQRRRSPDVVGALIRDAKGQTLAQTGRALRDLPRDAAERARGARRAAPPTASTCCSSARPSPARAAATTPRSATACAPSR